MIEINRENGTVTWGDYVLHMGLTPDALMQLYPQVTTMRDVQIHDGRHQQIFQLPTMNLDDYPLILEATYYNNRLHLILIKRPNPSNSPEANDRWWRQLPGWVMTAQKWLISQFGQPSDIRPGVLFDEEETMTPEEIKLLQTWTYDFEWGKAGFHYDGLEEPGDIYVDYDYQKHIKNWDELIAECDSLLHYQQEHNGIYVASLLALRALIEAIHPHYDFQSLSPRVGPGGLVLSPSQWKTKVVVHVRLANDVTKRYEIVRWDTTKRSFIAEGNHTQLVNELRVFLETEKM